MVIVLVVLFVIALVVLIIICNNSRRVVPFLKQYTIYYGDSPQKIQSKVQGEFISKGHLSYANQTVYKYNMSVLGNDAVVSFFFLNNTNLYEVDITYDSLDDKQIKALFNKSKEIIDEELKDDINYYCDNIEYTNEHEYYLSLGLNTGAIGISYMIKVKDNQLTITCIRNE